MPGGRGATTLVELRRHVGYVGQIALSLAEAEAVAYEEVVRHGEPSVPYLEIDQSSVRAVEKGAHGERPRVAHGERAQDVMEGEARVDDVLHH